MILIKLFRFISNPVECAKMLLMRERSHPKYAGQFFRQLMDRLGYSSSKYGFKQHSITLEIRFELNCIWKYIQPILIECLLIFRVLNPFYSRDSMIDYLLSRTFQTETSTMTLMYHSRKKGVCRTAESVEVCNIGQLAHCSYKSHCFLAKWKMCVTRSHSLGSNLIDISILLFIMWLIQWIFTWFN